MVPECSRNEWKANFTTKPSKIVKNVVGHHRSCYRFPPFHHIQQTYNKSQPNLAKQHSRIFISNELKINNSYAILNNVTFYGHGFLYPAGSTPAMAHKKSWVLGKKQCSQTWTPPTLGGNIKTATLLYSTRWHSICMLGRPSVISLPQTYNVSYSLCY